MNWKTVKSVADEPGKTWYLEQKEVAALLGCSRQTAAVFLKEQSVPYYRIGRAKSYFLPEVLEAVEKTRYKSPVCQG